MITIFNSFSCHVSTAEMVNVRIKLDSVRNKYDSCERVRWHSFKVLQAWLAMGANFDSCIPVKKNKFSVCRLVTLMHVHGR